MKEKLKMLVVMMALVALVFARRWLAEGRTGQEGRTADLTKLAQAVTALQRALCRCIWCRGCAVS